MKQFTATRSRMRRLNVRSVSYMKLRRNKCEMSCHLRTRHYSSGVTKYECSQVAVAFPLHLARFPSPFVLGVCDKIPIILSNPQSGQPRKVFFSLFEHSFMFLLFQLHIDKESFALFELLLFFFS